MFQRCSLPEKLWTALISSETALHSADFWKIQYNFFWFFVRHFYQNFPKYLIFEAHNSGFQLSLRKEVSNKNLGLQFRTGKRYNTHLNFWVYCYCSSNKTDMVQLLEKNFAFSGVKFQDYSKRIESMFLTCKILPIFYRNTILMITSITFSALWTTVSYFESLVYMCNYQRRFWVNQRWISAVQRSKSNVSELRKSASNSADSELFLYEAALFCSKTALKISVPNSADSLISLAKTSVTNHKFSQPCQFP